MEQPILAGFDFPIGLPFAYGRSTGFPDFPAFLSGMSPGAWADFRNIARQPDEISLRRPFYPAGVTRGLKQGDLLRAHGVAELDAIRRLVERATPERRAACPIFWTLGGNQVGRGALSGWDEVIRPAVAAGAHLWPFDGSLSALAETGGITLAETYPAEAYGHVGVRFQHGQSKRRQDDRLSHVPSIMDWATARNVVFTAPANDELVIGFGADAAGEDRFDAMLGLLGMIEVVLGGRSESPYPMPPETRWEGWILGAKGAADAE
jgi:hypothetical protein